MQEPHKPSRISRLKEYLKNNAPAVVTAAAAVGILFTVRSAHKEAHDALENVYDNRDRFADMLEQFKDEGREFEWYPGVGMWYGDKPKQELPE